MKILNRKILFQGSQRMVEGVPIKRDADFAILFEKRNFVEIIKNHFSISDDCIDFYEGWDRDVAHYSLPSGKIVAMTYAQGTAFSASAIERFLRSGVYHIIRIGTCGSLNSSIKPWDIIMNHTSISNDSTSFCYKNSKRKFFSALLDEIQCPLGSMYRFYNKFPSFTKFFLKNLNKNYYKYYTSYSDAELDTLYENQLLLIKHCENFVFHKTKNYTISARYLENSEIIKILSKEVNISTIDMETAAIFNCSAYHNISSSSINIVIDSPLETMLQKSDEVIYYSNFLKSKYHGIPNHDMYSICIPKKIVLCTQAAFNTFEFISNN